MMTCIVAMLFGFFATAVLSVAAMSAAPKKDRIKGAKTAFQAAALGASEAQQPSSHDKATSVSAAPTTAPAKVTKRESFICCGFRSVL